jgi:hypothetical protein
MPGMKFSCKKYSRISSAMSTRELNFLTSPADVLKALLQSKEEGTSIGIRAHSLGTETIVTAVEDIVFEESQTLIIFKPYDSTGYILPSRRINLHEIQGVYPFASPFSNPYLSNLGKDKSWFF